MANSAFTPSTSTVTNNVPVNVPVVTEWQSYTTTLSSGMGGGTSTLQYRRVGSSVEIKGTITVGTVTTGSATFTLPSGITINTSLIAASGQNVLGYWSDLKASANIITGGWTGAVFYNGTTTLLGLDSTTNASRAFAGTNSNSLFASGDPLTVNCTIPVAEWAGSGTTTLATRAVEEYAYNTDTSTADATTGFGYGPSGQAFGSFISNSGNAVTRKRVRFQSAIQATDNIIVEVDNGTGTWSKASESQVRYTVDGAGRYGFGRIEYINSTDVDVNFGKSGASAAGLASWAGSNGDPWSNYTTWKWRVRKVSSGAQVGYPVSARNIVGDTSGTTVPTGMIGELAVGTVLTPTLTTNVAANMASITLQPGVWELHGQAYHILGGPTTISFSRVSISSSSASTDLANFNTYGSCTTAGIDFAVQVYRRVNISSATTYYLVTQTGFASGSCTGLSNSYLTATRIA